MEKGDLRDDDRAPSPTVSPPLTDAQLRELMDSLPHLVWTCLPEGPCDYLSRQWVEYTGIAEAPQLGYGWLEQLHPDDRERVKAEWAATVGRGVPFDIEFRIRRADGEHRWFRTRAVPLRDAAGNIAKWCGSNGDIDDYKRMEAALRVSAADLGQTLDRATASEASLRALFANMLEGRAHCRTLVANGQVVDFVFLDVNAAFERATGLVNVVGRRVSELIPNIATTHPDVFASYGRVVDSGRPERFETYVEPLGRWFDVAAYRHAPNEFIAVVDDISTRKRAEQALRESTDAYRAVVESASEIIITIDRHSRIIRTANNSVERILGYSADELIGQELTVLMPERFREAHRAGVQRYAETGVRRIEWRGTRVVGLHKSGKEVELEASYGEFTRDGEIQIVGVLRDVSALRDAEKSLQLFRTLIDRSNDLVEVFDPVSGRFFDVNERACLSLGYTRHELLALSVLDVDPALDRNSLESTLRALRKVGFANVEGRHRRKDGTEFPVEVSISLVQLDREYAVAVVRDVTEVRQLQERFLHAQKMEAVGRLAGGIAHDFNNVLSVVLTYADLISADLAPTDPLAVDIGEIRKAGNRAAGLTQQLLAFSRRQVLKPRVLNLNQSLAAIEKLLSRLLGADITLTLLPATALGSVMCDPGQIEQILMNLAVNARDAMPRGGKLTIQTANVDLDDHEARTRFGIAPGSYVELTVVDTGVGMDRETQSRVFEPFFTTKSQGRGTGLGLATVFGIVTQSGGHVSVDSTVGAGTTFKILFPTVAADAETLTAAPQVAELAQGSGTILLVEDDEQVRSVASAILRRAGYVVLVASNGGEAILLCEQNRTTIDLLLTDVVMPLMSGRQLAERLSEGRPELRVLYMSGYTDDAILQHGVVDSGVDLMEKPITPSSLARRVREALARRTRSG